MTRHHEVVSSRMFGCSASFLPSYDLKPTRAAYLICTMAVNMHCLGLTANGRVVGTSCWVDLQRLIYMATDILEIYYGKLVL